MSIGITWCTIEEAAAKYSLKKSLILKWVTKGVVRGEEENKIIVRVNVDDIELEVRDRGGIFKK